MAPDSMPQRPATLVLDPVAYTLFTLRLLNNAARSLGPIQRIAIQLTVQQRQTNLLVTETLLTTLTTDRIWPTMAAYLDHLAQVEPAAWRDAYLSRLARTVPGTSAAEIIHSSTAFMQALNHVHPQQALDAAVVREIHPLLADPAMLHDVGLTHLRTMWQTYLEAEWTLNEPGLQRLVLQAHDLCPPGQPLQTMLKTLIGRSVPPAWATLLGRAQQVYVVPLNVGATTLLMLPADDVLWVGAPVAGAMPHLLRTSPIGRNELLARLQALADDTRLKILELLNRHDELSAQAIINELGLPQSSTSRHLNQLRAAGFVQEQRRGGASKHYRLVPTHLASTWTALSHVLAGEVPAPIAEMPVAEHVPTAIRRFANQHGTIVIWPGKHADRMAVLAYLAELFEPGRQYTEPEVNTILKQHPATDHVNLRRMLCDTGLLARESNGSAYWRESGRT